MSEPGAYVVCVDDEQAVLNQLSAQITRRFGASHTVECTQSAEEALALIDEIFASGGEVQLVICDQVMPGLKGDRFLEAVHKARPEIMKILLTGQAGMESAIYAINNAGLNRYIEKPWEASDLNLAVETLLTQHRLRSELTLQNERLERRNRELRALHDVGLRMASAAEGARVLALLSEAAKRVYGRALAILARATPAQPAQWWLLPPAELRAKLGPLAEAAIERSRPEIASLPQGVVSVPLAHGGSLYGFILLQGEANAMGEAVDLLKVLASQAAASLNNLRLVQERLEAERLSTVGRMIATIVHDFRNPITAVKGYAGMFEEFDLAPERRKEFAHLIIEEADRMSAMSEEILEFTRGTKTPLIQREIDIPDLASKLERLLLPELAARGLRFTQDLRYTGSVVLDLDRMKRALLNIANNAIDAMPDGGCLSLASRLVDGRLELTLTDTGRGIPEDVISRVFEPFFSHGKSQGIGLGMAITRRIVEEHGGSIGVLSRPGQGTCFRLSLPLRPAGSRG